MKRYLTFTVGLFLFGLALMMPGLWADKPPAAGLASVTAVTPPAGAWVPSGLSSLSTFEAALTPQPDTPDPVALILPRVLWPCAPSHADPGDDGDEAAASAAVADPVPIRGPPRQWTT